MIRVDEPSNTDSDDDGAVSGELLDGQYMAPEPDYSQPIRQYFRRPDEYTNTTLKDFTARYYWRGARLITRRIPVVVQIFPKTTTCSANDPEYEDFCRRALMLHKPWRTEADLLQEFPTWACAFEADDIEQRISLGDELEDYEPGEEYGLDLEDDENERHVLHEERMVVSRAGPSNMSDSNVELGRREIGQNEEWDTCRRRYPNYEEARSFISDSKKSLAEDDFASAASEQTELPNFQLSPEQHAVISSALTDARESRIMRAIVAGTAGTGKSTVINRLVHELGAQYGEGCVRVLAPTGVAAFNIMGLRSILPFVCR